MHALSWAGGAWHDRSAGGRLAGAAREVRVGMSDVRLGLNLWSQAGDWPGLIKIVMPMVESAPVPA
jgi:hypothetical protein